MNGTHGICERCSNYLPKSAYAIARLIIESAFLLIFLILAISHEVRIRNMEQSQMTRQDFVSVFQSINSLNVALLRVQDSIVENQKQLSYFEDNQKKLNTINESVVVMVQRNSAILDAIKEKFDEQHKSGVSEGQTAPAK